MSQSLSQANEMLDQYQAEQDKAQKLMSSGIVGQATIVQQRDTGKLVNNMPELEFDLDVQLEGREPYTTTHRQVILTRGWARCSPERWCLSKSTPTIRARS